MPSNASRCAFFHDFQARLGRRHRFSAFHAFLIYLNEDLPGTELEPEFMIFSGQKDCPKMASLSPGL
jgi:hypothetical protein